MLFFEAFEQISADQELQKLYSEADVVKVLASRQTKDIFVCIRSAHLIDRTNIRKMEELLNRQLFLHTGNRAIIKPTFELSAQYSLTKLYPIYRDSILEELREQSVVSYHIFSNAEVIVEETKLLIRVTNSCVVKDKMTKLKDYLETMFQERFDYTVHVWIEYIEPREKQEDDRLEYRNRMLQMSEKEAMEEGFQADVSYVREASYANGGDGQSGTYGSNQAVGAGQRDGTREGTATRASETEKKLVEAAKKETAVSKAQDAAQKPAAKPFGGKSAYDKGKGSYKKLPPDPSVVYGRNFEGNPMPICDIIGEVGEVVIRGKLIKPETRAIGNNEKSIITFVITDFTDSIKFKLFAKTIEVEEYLSVLKPGGFFLIKGVAQNDTYERDIMISSVVGIKTINDFTSSRKDQAPKKRVELHAHTMMSDMDSVVDVKAMVKRAFKWGHSAIAVTDHGVVQAFPDASHAINPKDYADEEEQKRAKEFKVIYGMEAYLVDDLKEVVTNAKGQSLEASFVVFDIETTGFSQSKDRIIEIGAVKVEQGEIVDKYSTFINPEIPIPYEIEQLTSINDNMVISAPTIDVILPQFLSFCEGCVLVAHNASFDVGFIRKNAERLGMETDFTVIDTVGLSRILLPELNRHKLNVVAKALGVSLENHHRAVDDAGATAEIFLKFCAMLREREITSISEIDKLGRMSAEAIRKLPSYHAILLAQNDVGRVNLYKMVSLSHIEYFNKRPKIPKSLLMECREGILLGSACEAGEVFRAVISNQPHEQIARLVNFYDYLEIQPLCNNGIPDPQ
jgi:DNA polymerase-3 subunit alpha (Gram-positive type)